MYFVYIVECKDGSLYTGITKDIDKRMMQHNTGKGAKYTRGRNPVTLRYSESFDTVNDALKREREIKKYSRRQKLYMIGNITFRRS